jgi:hypothetical protein
MCGPFFFGQGYIFHSTEHLWLGAARNPETRLLNLYFGHDVHHTVGLSPCTFDRSATWEMLPTICMLVFLQIHGN